MKDTIQWLRSLVFLVLMYGAMPVLGLICLPWALVDRRGAFAGVRWFCLYARWAARRIVGLRSEVRGAAPEGRVIIAAKHQSFFDIILIVSVTPRPRFIMKRELLRAPVLGWYAKRIGCIPVDRGRRGKAITQMMEAVAEARDELGQLVIYPQGTRVAPGAMMPYKIGTGLIYEELQQPCIPAATNVGVFWPKRGILRKPGLAVVEFLPAIPANLPRQDFMAALEEQVEAASDRLMAEAGFVAG
jgi:1-acyl-sn-glycerol-3-phosphate acyltransferase